MPAHSRVQDRRNNLGLSLDQLAERLRPFWPKISAAYLSKIENGKRPLPVDKLKAFAIALECTEADLLDPLH